MKFPHRLCLASCLLLAIGFGRPTFGEEPSAFSAHGPLHYRNHNPIYLQIANIVPMRVVPLPKGVAEAAVGISYANIFEQFTTVSHDVLLDMEILRPTLSLAYGMGRGMAISVELPFTHGGGGIIDGFLEGFHNAFGLPNAGRENFPRDQFVYRMRRPDGTLFESGAPSFVPGDLMMTLRQEVLPEVRRRPAIGWFAVIEPPTAKASAGWGNGGVDFGIGLSAEKSYRRWHGYLNCGYFVTPGRTDLTGLIHDLFFSYVLAGEFSLSRRLALHAQLHGGTPLLGHMGEMRWNDPPLDLALGLSGDYPKLLWGKGAAWEIGFSEDLHADGPSIDFTLFTRFALRFGTQKGMSSSSAGMASDGSDAGADGALVALPFVRRSPGLPRN